jgi:multimeric flavodoxin WrbA
MKIISINGSPRGNDSNTKVMIESFLKGARSSGAEYVNIVLSDKKISPCRGCYTCWFKTPGKCVIEDDMTDITGQMKDSGVIILSSPVYFNNVTGIMKTFIDRLTSSGNDPDNRKGNSNPAGFVMMSNCGLDDRSQFDVISLWIRKMTAMLGTDLIAELYTTGGRMLTNPSEELEESTRAYLEFIESCGKEIAADRMLGEKNRSLSGRNLADF